MKFWVTPLSGLYSRIFKSLPVPLPGKWHRMVTRRVQPDRVDRCRLEHSSTRTRRYFARALPTRRSRNQTGRRQARHSLPLQWDRQREQAAVLHASALLLADVALHADGGALGLVRRAQCAAQRLVLVHRAYCDVEFAVLEHAVVVQLQAEVDLLHHLGLAVGSDGHAE